MALPLKLRPWGMDDLPSLVKYANNKKIFDNMRDMFPHPYYEEHGITFINMALVHNPVQIFAIDLNGEAIGSVGIFPQSDISRINAEIGYWIAEPFWGQGAATFAVKEIIKYGFNTFDISRIFAVPFPLNIASQKVLTNARLKHEATLEKAIIKNGVVMDEMIYAIRK